MQIRAIIFDFGNVLVSWDARKLYQRFFPTPQAVDSFLEEIHFADWNAQQDAGRSFKDGVADLSNQFPHYAELIQAYDTYWEESLTGTIDETVEIAQQFKQAGYLIYILTNSSDEKFKIARQKYSFLKMFDDIIVSGEHKLLKPDPAIYHLILNRIKQNANQCVFIDDSLLNIESARALGFHTIHYHSPAQLLTSLRDLLIKK